MFLVLMTLFVSLWGLVTVHSSQRAQRYQASATICDPFNRGISHTGEDLHALKYRSFSLLSFQSQHCLTLFYILKITLSNVFCSPTQQNSFHFLSSWHFHRSTVRPFYDLNLERRLLQTYSDTITNVIKQKCRNKLHFSDPVHNV